MSKVRKSINTRFSTSQEFIDEFMGFMEENGAGAIPMQNISIEEIESVFEEMGIYNHDDVTWFKTVLSNWGSKSEMGF